MKKSLLATVAAVALIAGTGMVSAEGAKDQPGMKAGADIKAEPEMKKGADIKAGAQTKGKAETTGAGVESKSEMKAEPKADVKADSKADTQGNADNADKAKPSTTGQAAPAAKSTADDKAPAPKSSTNEKAAPATGSSAQGTQAPAAKPSAQGQTGTNQAGSQTSASVSLTTEQKTKIRTTVLQSSSAPKVSRTSIDFNIRVGTVVPRSVRFVEVPSTLVEIYPQWRGHRYFVVDDEIIIVDARTLQIVAIIEV